MDSRAIRVFVNDNPNGVVITMVDGTVYRVPHRDYIWFTPAYGEPESRAGRLATSFYLHDTERENTHLVNALLVKHVEALKPGSGNGHSKSKRSGKKR